MNHKNKQNKQNKKTNKTKMEIVGADSSSPKPKVEPSILVVDVLKLALLMHFKSLSAMTVEQKIFVAIIKTLNFNTSFETFSDIVQRVRDMNDGHLIVHIDVFNDFFKSMKETENATIDPSMIAEIIRPFDRKDETNMLRIAFVAMNYGIVGVSRWTLFVLSHEFDFYSNPDMRILFYIACVNGHIEIIKLLFDDNVISPLTSMEISGFLTKCAAEHNHFDIAKLIIDCLLPELTDEIAMCCIKHAFTHKNIDMVFWIFDRRLMSMMRKCPIDTHDSDISTMADNMRDITISCACNVSDPLFQKEVVECVFQLLEEKLSERQIECFQQHLKNACKLGNMPLLQWVHDTCPSLIPPLFKPEEDKDMLEYNVSVKNWLNDIVVNP